MRFEAIRVLHRWVGADHFMTAALAQGPGQGQRQCGTLVRGHDGWTIPTDRDRIMLRWLSTANYELAYRGHLYVLDAYFDRGPRNRPTGSSLASAAAPMRSSLGTRTSIICPMPCRSPSRLKAPVYGA